ncbi:MAG: S24 family peptidase [Nocardioides sp.]
MSWSAMRRWGMAVVRGRSMLPTLREGDRLLVRHGAVPEAGDLVVVRLSVRGGARVVAVKRATLREPDGWWVDSDNPAEGVDSSTVGTVPDADVLAVVRRRIWPLTGRPPLRA